MSIVGVSMIKVHSIVNDIYASISVRRQVLGSVRIECNNLFSYKETKTDYKKKTLENVCITFCCFVSSTQFSFSNIL